VSDNIISYIEMCQREGISLQKGMNFNCGGNHSVILMSVRPGAPYNDRLEDGGTTLIYEGHDQPRGTVPNPKLADQIAATHSGLSTENGKFHQAAQATKVGRKPPERVRVYEKIKAGIWSYNGVFHLIDSWTEFDGKRRVYKFKLVAVEGDEDFSHEPMRTPQRRRIIPTKIKLAVWKRDQGKCVVCEATDELHFDHDLPWAKGGTSITEANVQLLCARHNLQKSDRIR
jgi:HNH endonuclease